MDNDSIQLVQRWFIALAAHVWRHVKNFRVSDPFVQLPKLPALYPKKYKQAENVSTTMSRLLINFSP